MPDAPIVLAHATVGLAPGEPVSIRLDHPSLVALMSSRQHLREASLGDSVWVTPGIYTLLGPSDQPGLPLVKVGMSRAREGVRSRVIAQLSDDWWDRAVLFASNSRDGFTSSDVAWLEGYVGDRLDEHGIRRRDIAPQGDSTVHATHQQFVLTPYGTAVLGILNLVGVLASGEPPVLADDTPEADRDAGAPPNEPQRMSWLDAAVEVMRNSERDWTTRAVLDEILRRGLRDVGPAQTPEATLRRDMALRGLPRGIEKVGPGTFRFVARN